MPAEFSDTPSPFIADISQCQLRPCHQPNKQRVNMQDIPRLQTMCWLWDMGLCVLVGSGICKNMCVRSHGGVCSCVGRGRGGAGGQGL